MTNYGLHKQVTAGNKIPKKSVQKLFFLKNYYILNHFNYLVLLQSGWQLPILCPNLYNIYPTGQMSGRIVFFIRTTQTDVKHNWTN